MDALYEQHLSSFPQLSRHMHQGIHYVATTAELNNTPIVILHGVFSSSYPFLELANKLGSIRPVYVMDLPGWGFSTPIRTDTDATSIIDGYVDAVQNFIEHVLTLHPQSTNVVLLAHSFSGFIAIHLADHSPSLIERLVLMCPAGLFPVSNSNGMYWALIFYTAIHYWIVYYMGWLIRPLARLWSQYHLVHFSLAHLSTNLPAWNVLQKFIRISTTQSCWTRPCLPTLLRLDVPFVFIYGEEDTLTPPHHGVLVNMLTRGAIKCFQVPNTTHNPHSDTAAFIPILEDAIQSASTYQKQSYQKQSMLMHILSMYNGYWSMHKTRSQIDDMYNSILAGQN